MTDPQKIRITLKPSTMKTLQKDLEGWYDARTSKYGTPQFIKILESRLEKKYGYHMEDLFSIHQNQGCFTVLEKE